jgi:hypothetical protein
MLAKAAIQFAFTPETVALVSGVLRHLALYSC